jgi:hypothetical protein
MLNLLHPIILVVRVRWSAVCIFLMIVVRFSVVVDIAKHVLFLILFKDTSCIEHIKCIVYSTTHILLVSLVFVVPSGGERIELIASSAMGGILGV